MNSQRVAVHGAAAMLFVVVLFPALWMLQLSFRSGGDIFDLSLVFTPTLDNYRALWTGLFPGSFGNSVVVSLAATTLSLLFGVPPAYALSRCRFRARRSIALWILATRMAPPVAFTIPFFLAYLWLGLIDSLAGLVIIYLTFNLALVVWLMRNFFDGVPRALEEAAWIDGCGVWSGFRLIALPIAAPGLAATGVLCFILSWNDFFYADLDVHQRADGAGRDRQLHPVRGLGVGQDRGRRNPGHAPGRNLQFVRAPVSRARADGRRRQGVTPH